MLSAEELSVGGHRVFQIVKLVEEIEPLTYAIDGVNAGEIFPYEEYSPYWEGMEFDKPLDEELDQYLVIMGRLTGRFLDRDWLASPGLLGELPPTR
ncbi:hypothetical protein D5H75_31885 [Bailinhaonella thermotolerans]|uniref:Uncharacterized protein n=2 Tax=Bailinhaonella thermotolerans TaxID=1070861 RepID=A0A3A4A7W6_9ACTN|nr:hypothetical protein D5H75_31885 [Bailinhaonella thermotolerans]